MFHFSPVRFAVVHICLRRVKVYRKMENDLQLHIYIFFDMVHSKRQAIHFFLFFSASSFDFTDDEFFSISQSLGRCTHEARHTHTQFSILDTQHFSSSLCSRCAFYIRPWLFLLCNFLSLFFSSHFLTNK